MGSVTTSSNRYVINVYIASLPTSLASLPCLVPLAPLSFCVMPVYIRAAPKPNDENSISSSLVVRPLKIAYIASSSYPVPCTSKGHESESLGYHLTLQPPTSIKTSNVNNHMVREPFPSVRDSSKWISSDFTGDGVASLNSSFVVPGGTLRTALEHKRGLHRVKNPHLLLHLGEAQTIGAQLSYVLPLPKITIEARMQQNSRTAEQTAHPDQTKFRTR
ncbi:hypothetical protein ACO22_03087 [Paracoccidioides brasiliensis]|uniref:Uncharacterized protein n=1 Tax=Paracoccidioides brasiliensis TaxID=121759 RepID=A0A1D2JH34_PARBR|nr:hypothetical protein ACO22_03087 [Paracoccidioides brasiliensis]